MSNYTIAPLAQQDLKSIWIYIGVENYNPTAANTLLQKFHDRFDLLAANPLMGELREDLRPDIRVFAADNYVIFYYPITDGIEVVGVIHGARHIESMFQDGGR